MSSDLEIWRMTWSHSPETPNLGQNRCFFWSRVTLKLTHDPETIRYLFYATSSFVHHFNAIGKLKLKLQSGNAQFGSKLMIFFVACDLEIWRMTLINSRAPLLCCFKLCIIHCHHLSLGGVTVPKRSIRVKIGDFFVACDLEISLMTWKNSRAPLLCCLKLCASFHCQQLSLTGVTVRKRSIWVKIGDFFFCCV